MPGKSGAYALVAAKLARGMKIRRPLRLTKEGETMRRQLLGLLVAGLCFAAGCGPTVWTDGDYVVTGAVDSAAITCRSLCVAKDGRLSKSTVYLTGESIRIEPGGTISGCCIFGSQAPSTRPEN
jgi:hypothetical protein